MLDNYYAMEFLLSNFLKFAWHTFLVFNDVCTLKGKETDTLSSTFLEVFISETLGAKCNNEIQTILFNLLTEKQCMQDEQDLE